MSFFTDVRDSLVGGVVNQFTIGVPLPSDGSVLPTGTWIIGQNIIADLPSSYWDRYKPSAFEIEKYAKIAALGLAAPAAVQVGGASGGNLVVNAIEGDPLLQNAGIAGAVDVAGLAIGSGIAATGFVDATAGGAVELGGTGLVEPAAEAAISPVSSAAVDAAATTPGGLSSIAGAAKQVVGTAGLVQGIQRLVNPPKPPIAMPRPASPLPAQPPAQPAAACNLCGAGRALLAIAPVAALAFS